MLKSFCLSAVALLTCLEISAVGPPYPVTTSNEQLVADQLQSIEQPNAQELDMLTQIIALDETDTSKALSGLSGAQYTALFASTELINRQFIRRLYDPLRRIISDPCSYEDEVYELCSADGIDAWAEGSVNRSFLDANRNAKGFKMSGYEVSAGAHKRLSSTWALGAALCYAINHVNFNLGGSCKSNVVLGGVYTLYRPAHYYALANVTFGYFTNDVHRRIPITYAKPSLDPNNAERIKHILKSRPNISEVTFYGEAGFDWNCACVLVQPFVGFEANRFIRSCKAEHGYAPARLIYNKKDVINAYSRLGVHLTTPENCYDLTFAFDAAWQYRLTSSRNSLTVRFADFGTPFNLTGIPDERHSAYAAFTVWSEIFEGWTLFLEASGERWRRISNYQFTGGLWFKW